MPAKTTFGFCSCGGDEPFGVGFVRGNRLLDHRMHAGFERRDAQRGVLKMRRGDDDRIHLAGLDELLAVAENFQRLVFVERSRDGVANGDKFAAADFSGLSR